MSIKKYYVIPVQSLRTLRVPRNAVFESSYACERKVARVRLKLVLALVWVGLFPAKLSLFLARERLLNALAHSCSPRLERGTLFDDG